MGYVPERYVQFLCLPEEDTAQLDSSFSSSSSSGIKDRAGSTGRKSVLSIMEACRRRVYGLTKKDLIKGSVRCSALFELTVLTQRENKTTNRTLSSEEAFY